MTADRNQATTTPVRLVLLRDAMRSRQAPARVAEELMRQFRRRRRARKPARSWKQVWTPAAVALTVLLAVLVFRPGPKVPTTPVDFSEITTAYMPVGLARPIAPDEFVQVIRVEVPRTELLRYGLPVGPGPASGRVLADVVLGEDGIARAIRFVQ